MITCNITNRKVHVGGIELDPAPSQKLVNHSPDGFAWGYAGSGPAQLALALLLHFTKDEEWSLQHYGRFKTEIVARWSMTATVRRPNRVIRDWIRRHGGPA